MTESTVPLRGDERHLYRGRYQGDWKSPWSFEAIVQQWPVLLVLFYDARHDAPSLGVQAVRCFLLPRDSMETCVELFRFLLAMELSGKLFFVP